MCERICSAERPEAQAPIPSMYPHLCQEHGQVKPSTGSPQELTVSNLTYKNSQCLAEKTPVSQFRPFSQKLFCCISPYQILPSNLSQSSASETCLRFCLQSKRFTACVPGDTTYKQKSTADCTACLPRAKNLRLRGQNPSVLPQIELSTKLQQQALSHILYLGEVGSLVKTSHVTRRK